ncbi:MAG: hypothetical protein HYZ96_01505 [Candidatus Omnitrophica bacterium]|nr:hypothetical protein [Candidatus Omnitrophota bacterium]
MPYPQLTVLPSAAKRIRHHDCWVFRDELAAPSSLANGAVVELVDPHAAFLAYAFYSAHAPPSLTAPSWRDGSRPP